MPKSEGSPEEKRGLLLDDEGGFEGFNRDSYPLYKTAIAKGVANQVSKWPSHLFAAFLAASLVMATFLLFAIVAALFCAPITTHTCRRSKTVEVEGFPNIYFVKHANRTWTMREMCHVESTIRENPEIKVYLINLLVEPQQADKFVTMDTKKIEITKDREMIEMLWEKSSNPVRNTIVSSRKLSIEAVIRRKLAAHYSNVRNVDVTIDDFFRGSMVSHICHKFDIETVEIAAKAYVLWNTPGVALDPYDARYLQRLGSYLCIEQCGTVTEAAMNREGSIQASGVTCQAFIGCLIHQLAVQGSSRNGKIVEECQETFCRRQNECPGLKILNEESPFDDKTTSCPTIYPPGVGSTRFSLPIPQNSITN